MSSSLEPKTILLTGASGFIAAHILNVFLEAGYNIRGTVRSEKSARAILEAHSGHAHQLSFSTVPDIVKEGAFDDAVQGVDGVIHAASPFVMSSGVDNERDLLIPAVEGTKNILQSILLHAPQVKRVVITSSFAALVDLHKGLRPEHIYTEADWNPETYEGAVGADAGTAYCASKAIAERAAWNFVEQHKPNFDITTILPPVVWGPVAHKVTSMKSLPTSPATFYSMMDGSLKEPMQTAFWPFVDVRDVALAHLKGYEVPEAAGQRFFTTSGRYSWQMVADILREGMPEIKDKVPVGKPGIGLGAEVYGVDATKAEAVLGIKFRKLEETVLDSAKSLIQLRDSLAD